MEREKPAEVPILCVRRAQIGRPRRNNHWRRTPIATRVRDDGERASQAVENSFHRVVALAIELGVTRKTPPDEIGEGDDLTPRVPLDISGLKHRKEDLVDYVADLQIDDHAEGALQELLDPGFHPSDFRRLCRSAQYRCLLKIPMKEDD